MSAPKIDMAQYAASHFPLLKAFVPPKETECAQCGNLFEGAPIEVEFGVVVCSDKCAFAYADEIKRDEWLARRGLS